MRTIRPSALVSACLVAAAVAVTPMAAAPAHAAPLDHVAARTIVFVHGYTPGGWATSDCRHDFEGLSQELARWPGLYDNYQYWGYYPDDTNCTGNFGYATSRNTPIRWLGVLFAAQFRSQFRDIPNPTKVDIVAHSLGGLIVRSAMTYDPASFQTPDGTSLVEDVVNGGTPHNGGVQSCTGTCDAQVTDMSTGSAFLNDLNCRPFGDVCGPFLPWWTDWTDIGSTYTDINGNDFAVPLLSALYPLGDHEVMLSGVGHAQYFAVPLSTPDTYSISAAFNGLTDGAS